MMDKPIIRNCVSKVRIYTNEKLDGLALMGSGKTVRRK